LRRIVSVTAVEHTIEFGGQSLFDVVITTRGSADLEGVKLFGEELVTDPRFRAGSTVIVDHSELDLRPLTESDLQEIGRIASGLAERLGETVFAVVVPDAFTFGRARQSTTLGRAARQRRPHFLLPRRRRGVAAR
jgi:hypothetical protein